MPLTVARTEQWLPRAGPRGGDVDLRSSPGRKGGPRAGKPEKGLITHLEEIEVLIQMVLSLL